MPTLSPRPSTEPRTPRAGRTPRPGKEAPTTPTWKETIRFWVVTILVILFLRAFIFEPYRIPSESMENTLLVGDFLIVSKLHYGARTPNTLAIPFVGLYLPGVQLPQTRLPGFAEVERGDVVVFNYPASVDVVRGPVPRSVPIERRDPYIKRLTGMPGDTLAVVDKVLHINGLPQALQPTMKQRWRVTSANQDRLAEAQLAALGARFEGDVRTREGALAVPRQYEVTATAATAAALQGQPGVAAVAPAALPEGMVVSPLVFPDGAASNADQFGPVVVPAAGMTVALDAQTWPMYAEVITRHEGHEAELRPDSTVWIDGQPAASYTFAQDYYVAMGDNRDNSVDSRFWGFVPHDHLVGKAVLTFLSFKGEFPFVRVERFLRTIP